jgi:hypothetical protein
LVIWDPNRYYRDLGVDPRATRKELVEAYKAKNGSWSRRLTYVLKQLLNPETRRYYDRLPFGSMLNDLYVQRDKRRVRAKKASEDIAAGRRTLEEVQAEDERILNESSEMVDSDGASSENVSHPAGNLSTWPWAFYVWGPVSKLDQAKMREWQGALCSAFGERKESREIAVGVHIDLEPFRIVRVGYRIVVFLSDVTQPTEALAQRVASQMIDTV